MAAFYAVLYIFHRWNVEIMVVQCNSNENGEMVCNYEWIKSDKT